jgi:hypothetical protein
MGTPGALVILPNGKLARSKTTGALLRFNAAGECPECCTPFGCNTTGSQLQITFAGVDATACAGVTLNLDGTYTLTYLPLNGSYSVVGGTVDYGGGGGVEDLGIEVFLVCSDPIEVDSIQVADTGGFTKSVFFWNEAILKTFGDTINNAITGTCNVSKWASGGSAVVVTA